ncbi:MAG: phosphoglycerate dehydrogenase [Candidatus Goldbacteria bacterium]|nr:phosphoglycerate dehydrogenase [Candidatus Goldiibacteriota bacterium]
MYKILVSDKLADDAIQMLKKEKDIECVVKTGLDENQLAEELPNYDALIIRSGTKVTAKVLSQVKKLRIIGRAGVGVDNVDMQAATSKGIIVMNTPDANTLSTAEQTITLILGMARNLPQADASLKAKKWERNKFIGTELYGKTLGIIGLGRIGTEVAKRMLAFGMKVIGYDPFVTKEKAEALGIELGDLHFVIKNADILTFHVPKTKETTNMITAKEIEMMKDGVMIVNCARGGIINEADIADALIKGKVKKAAFDVYEKEPPFDSPLFNVDPDKIILAPHLGASTVEAQENVGKVIVEQVIEALRGGMIKNALNIPAIEPELLKEMQPYLSLNETLGSFCAQIIDGNVKSIIVEYSGDVTKYNLAILTIAAVKGMLYPVIGDSVNYVNAKLLAKERGIEIIEKTTTIKTDYPNLISVSIVSDKEKRSVFGILSVNREARIVMIDKFELEIRPEKNIIVYKNEDKPGVIGRLGTILGTNNINIASFALGRSKEEKIALGVLTVDSEVPKDVIESIKNMDDIIDVKSVVLK